MELPAPRSSLPVASGVRVQPVTYDYDLGTVRDLTGVSATIRQQASSAFPRAVTVDAVASTYAVTGVLPSRLAALPSGAGLTYVPNASLKSDTGTQTFDEPCIAYLSSGTVEVFGLHTLSVLATITLPAGTYVGLTIDGIGNIVACTATEARKVTYTGTQASSITMACTEYMAYTGTHVVSLSAGGLLTFSDGATAQIGYTSGNSGLAWTGKYLVIGNTVNNNLRWYTLSGTTPSLAFTTPYMADVVSWDVKNLAWDGTHLWATDATRYLWRVLVHDNMAPVGAWPSAGASPFSVMQGVNEFFGGYTFDDPALIAEKFDRMVDLGVKWLRFPPKSPTYTTTERDGWASDWQSVDLTTAFAPIGTILQAADARGINVFLLNPESGPFSYVGSSGTTFQDWAANDAKLAARLAEYVDSLNLSITVVHEACNEVNRLYDGAFGVSWAANGMTFANTATYACDFADKVHAAVPTALVSNPSVSYSPYDHPENLPGNWLAAFLAAGLFSKVDVLTTHAYIDNADLASHEAYRPDASNGPTAGDAFGIVTELAWYAERGGKPDLPVMVGEYGWSSDLPTQVIDEAETGLWHPNVVSMQVFCLAASAPTSEFGIYDFSTDTADASFTSLVTWGADSAKLAYAANKEKQRLARASGYSGPDGTITVQAAPGFSALHVRVTLWPTGNETAEFLSAYSSAYDFDVLLTGTYDFDVLLSDVSTWHRRRFALLDPFTPTRL